MQTHKRVDVYIIIQNLHPFCEYLIIIIVIIIRKNVRHTRTDGRVGIIRNII